MNLIWLSIFKLNKQKLPIFIFSLFTKIKFSIIILFPVFISIKKPRLSEVKFWSKEGNKKVMFLKHIMFELKTLIYE